MDSFLSLIGMLFFMFLVLSASVEVILEIFRGFLEQFGVVWAKSKISIEQSLDLLKEFSGNNSEMVSKVDALMNAQKQLKMKSKHNITTLNEIKLELSKLAGKPITDALKHALNEVALNVKAELDADKRKRVFIIRTLAAAVGCFLVWQSEFYVFQILSTSEEGKEWLDTLNKLQDPLINIFVGGFAAAAGSSYWHDQLDRLRNVKGVIDNARSLQLN
ncbi:hypothetical protein [Acaryochloris marina]|nr:hypothetical protein [Acaryochloris marina]